MKLRQTARTRAALQQWECLGEPAPIGAATDQWIAHELLLRVHRELQSAGKSPPPLSALLRSTEVYFPDEELRRPPKKPPGYEQLMRRLRAAEQEREYQRMLSPEQQARAARSTDARAAPGEIKAVKEQLATIVNVLVSVVAVAWALWTWSRAWPVAARTLLALAGAIAACAADAAIYLGYHRKVGEARKAERAKVERREIKQAFVLSPGAPVAASPTVSAVETSFTPGQEASTTGVSHSLGQRLQPRRKNE